MNESLRRLVRMQELMLRSEELAERIAGIPGEVARLEKDLLAAHQGIEAERSRLDDLQKDRRRLEMDLAD
ncbi:MAG: hypothetical protein ACE5JH_10010, partial [Acidobacteriota bacterium]